MAPRSLRIPPAPSEIRCSRRKQGVTPPSEDLACHLVEQAQTIYHSGNASEEGVLLGFYAAISGEASAVSPREAGWIIQRLAELLEWKAPKLPEAPEQA